MFGIGGTELFLILLFAFLIFGPDKLPGMGRTLGRALRQFRNAQEGFSQVVQSEIVDPATQAMNADASKPNRNRAAELDEDADIDAPEGEDAPRARRTETFAERKKRLAAEKAAREAAEREAAAAAEAEQGADAEKDLDADAEAGQAAEPAAEAAADEPLPEPTPSKPSAADLYAMCRPSRPAADAAGSAEESEGHGAGRDQSEESGADDDAADDESEA